MNLVIEDRELQRLPITVDPQVLSGAPVFRGTRVPVSALLDNLESGITLDEFLDNFPTVTREHVLQILGFSKAILARVGEARSQGERTLPHSGQRSGVARRS